MTKSAEIEAKLVAFFNSETGAELGRNGDYYDRDPGDTAIVAMTALIDWAKKSRAFRRYLRSIGVL